MVAELSAAVGFLAAGTVASSATPLAIAVARRTDFQDRPREYRTHAAPTPFLGGAAVLVGFLVASILTGGTEGQCLVLIACTIGMWLVGTIDDRRALAPKWRLLAETIAAIALIGAGLKWTTGAGAGVDFVLSVIWTVGLVNAFNLMDNLDGACGTVGGVSAVGIGILAVIESQSVLAGLAFGVAGACAAFLRWNLSSPAKIFLGDGGSMPLGLLVAALAMASGRHLPVGPVNLLAGALLVGLPILDTALVSVSRMRRGITIVTGGRDHLTHRLLVKLDTPHAVAAALACGQACLCAAAIAGELWGTIALGVLAAGAACAGALTIGLLDTARWRPPDIAIGHLSLPGRLRRSQVGADSP